MKHLKVDLLMILLSLITLNIWYYKDYSYKYGFLVYFLIFTYLFLKQKPITYFLVVILFSVMSTHTDINSYTVEYILVHILFIYSVLRNVNNRYIVLGNILIPLLIYLLYSVLSISWSPDTVNGWHGIMNIIGGYQIYFILTNGSFKLKKANLFSISKIATYLMLTLTAEIYYNYYYYGFETVIQSKNLVNLGWGYSNLIAVVYVLLIPVALYKYLDKKRYHALYFIFDLINISGLILTLSRGAIVGAIVSLLLFGIIYIRLHFITRYISIAAIISYIVYKSEKLYYYFELIKGRFTGNDFFDDSNRFPLYELAIKMFKEKPWFGHGIKSSRYLIPHYLDGRSNVFFHNFVLQIAATLGIIGLILFLFIVIKWFVVLYKPKDAFVVCSALAIIGALTHQMVDISFDKDYFGLYFYSIISLVEIYRHYIKKDPVKMNVINF